MRPTRQPLVLRDGKTWQFRHNCRTANRTFWQLLVDDYRANEAFVFKKLGITRQLRKERQNTIGVGDAERVLEPEKLEKLQQKKKSELKTLRCINKGLAMELLVATLLSCLASPKVVRPWCLQSPSGDPKMAAGVGSCGTHRSVRWRR